MISLNYRDSRPIYEQIKDELKKLIVTGGLAAEERLPSVRTLATQLSINPNTIQRAYNELEGEGYIFSIPGKGSFASANVGTDENRKRHLLEKVRELLAELRYLGVRQEELLAGCPLYRKMWESHIGAKNWSVGKQGKEAEANV